MGSLCCEGGWARGFVVVESKHFYNGYETHCWVIGSQTWLFPAFSWLHVLLFGVIVVGCGWGLVCGWLSALCGLAVVVGLCGVGLLVVNWIVDVMMHLCVSVMFFCCC